MWRLAYAVSALLFIVSFIAGWEQLFAHADLVRADPPPDSRLRAAPVELELFFSQGLKHVGSFVQVENSAGERLEVRVVFDDADPKAMKATISGMTDPGAYRVRWQTLSADDDDYHDGSYQLILLNPDGSIPSSVQSSAARGESGNDTLIVVALGAIVLLLLVALGVFLRGTARSRQ
jgi:methionine-rich copper-binding protein CopC